jgi:CheY-specific phosphatase CheX
MGQASGKTFEHLRSFMREVSQQKFRELGHATDSEYAPLALQRDVLAHWVAFVLITGDRIRITFRAHFNTETATQFLKQTVSGTSSQYEDTHAYELLKEYCNLCAGEIKRVLGTNEVTSSVSLPLMIRGFDQIFEPSSRERVVVDDRWIVRGGGLSYFCSSRIEAEDSRDIKQEVTSANHEKISGSL